MSNYVRFIKVFNLGSFIQEISHEQKTRFQAKLFYTDIAECASSVQYSKDNSYNDRFMLFSIADCIYSQKIKPNLTSFGLLVVNPLPSLSAV